MNYKESVSMGEDYNTKKIIGKTDCSCLSKHKIKKLGLKLTLSVRIIYICIVQQRTLSNRSVARKGRDVLMYLYNIKHKLKLYINCAKLFKSRYQHFSGMFYIFGKKTCKYSILNSWNNIAFHNLQVCL